MTFPSWMPTPSVMVCFSAGAQEYEGTDSFTRADNSSSMGVADSGQTWTAGNGTAGIISNAAYFSALVGGYGTAYMPCLANGAIQVTVATCVTGAGLSFRQVDGSSFWSVRANTGTGKWDLYRTDAEVDTLITSTASAATANGTVVKVQPEGSTILVSVNGSLVLTYTDTAKTYATAQNAGIYTTDTTARFDVWSASFVWTDISTYVRGSGSTCWSWFRGRTHEFDRAETGTCTLQLDNRDRRFEPEYSGSPYYPFVLPQRRVKIVATWSSVDYPRYYGFIERWPLTLDQSLNDAIVTVTAADVFGSLSYRVFSDYSSTVQSLTPYAYYRMGGTNTSVADTGPNQFAALTPTLGSGTLTPTSPGLLSALAGDDGAFTTNGAYWTAPSTASVSNSSDFTISLLISTSSVGTTALLVSGAGGTAITFRLLSSQVQVGTGAHTLTSTSTLSSNTTYHLAFVRRGLVLEIWINGVLDNSTTLGAVDNLTAGGWQIGNTTTNNQKFDEVAWWNAALTGGQILNLANIAGPGPSGVATTLAAGQLTGTRVGKILDAAGIGPLNRTIDPGTAACAADNLATANPRDMLEKVRATEYGGGLLFADGSGHVVFRDNNYTRTQTSAVTFGGTGLLMYSITDPSLDKDRIYNLVTVSMQDNTSVVVGDAASQQSYEQRPVSFATVHQTTTDARSQALWVRYTSKDPQLRFDAVTMKPRSQGGIFADLLSRELGDRVTVQIQPPGGGAPISREVVIEKITETVSVDDWTLSFQLAPEPTVHPGSWRLGVAGLSELGVSTVLNP